MPQIKYDFQKLDVYQKALDFAERVFRVTERFPQPVQFSLGDQFRRASLSICNNLAEGAQKRVAQIVDAERRDARVGRRSRM